MEARLLSHAQACSSSALLRPAFPRSAAVLAAPRLQHRRPRSLAAVAAISMPVPSPAQPSTSQALGNVVPSEDVLRVTTVHSPEELTATLEANKDKLVVLMCKAKGCRPCKLFARKYARAADLYRDSVFLEIFGDETKDTRKLMQEMKIKVTPTFVLYRGGERVHSHGGVNEANLHNAVAAHLTEGEAGYGHKVQLECDETDED